MNPKIYIASRARIPERSAEWRRLRDQEGWQIVSTWIDEAGPGETKNFTDLWNRIVEEIRSCDGLILYVEDGDMPLKGAFVEVGIAIGLGKTVCIVSPDRHPEAYGSWVHHDLVMWCDRMEQARGFIHMNSR